MKFIRYAVFALATVTAMLTSALSLAQSYPTSNPVYIPTASLAAQSFSAPGAYTFVTSGVSVATLRVTGTCTSLAGTVQVSNDAINWTTVPITPVAGGAAAYSVSAPGFWNFSTAGMTRARLNITALSAACSVTMAATPHGFVAAADPCQSAAIPKSSAAINIGSATTTAVVAKATGKVTYVCSFNASIAGTSPTVLFKYGTQTTTPCDTGATSVSGTYAPTSGSVLALGTGSVTMQTAVTTDLCITTAGTGPSVQGVLTYVQQ